MRDGFSVDPYLSRVYRDGIYTCLEFACEVWKDLTGEGLGDRLPILHVPSQERRIAPADLRGFKRLSAPAQPSIVVMRRSKAVPHMGVFLRRRILHLNEMGASFQPPEVATLGFKTVNYYQ